MIYTFKEVDAKTIESYFANHPQGSFAQSIEMANVRADAGRTIHYVAVYYTDTIVAAAQVSVIAGKFTSADITAGPLLDFSNLTLLNFFTENIKTFLAEKNCVYLTINPNIRYSEDILKSLKKAGWEYSGRINASEVGIRGGIRWIYVKDLTDLTEENYQATYAKRHRRYIRNHDQNLVLRTLKRDELSLFTNIMRHTAERRQFVSRKDSYFESLYDRFGDKVTFKVVELKQDGKVIPIAAIAFIETNNEVISYLGGALSEYSRYRASYLLHDDMIHHSVKKGYKRYNFYGIEGAIEDPASEGYGIYEFKAKFGTGEAIELIGEFVLPIQRAKYTLFKLARKIKK